MADAIVGIFAHKRSLVNTQHRSGIIKSEEVIISSGFVLCQHLKSLNSCYMLVLMLKPHTL